MIHYIIFMLVTVTGQPPMRYDICAEENLPDAQIVVQALKDGSFREQREVDAMAYGLKQFYPVTKIEYNIVAE